MIAALTLLFTCHVAWSQDPFSVDWNFTNKYGAPSFWLHADSTLYISVTILLPNTTGTIGFGAIMRNDNGTLTRHVPRPRYFHPNNTHLPFVDGPFTVEELRAANETYAINVQMSIPALGNFIYLINFPYILCLDQDEQCQGRPESACRRGSFCFRNLYRCMPFTESIAANYCTVHEALEPHKVCDVKRTAYNSLCRVYKSPFRAQTVQSILLGTNRDCNDPQVFFKDRGSNRPIFPGSYRRRSEPLSVSCSISDVKTLDLMQVAERLEGGNVSFRRNISCDSPINLGNPKSILSVTYLSVVDLSSGAMSYVHLVNMMFNRTLIKVTLCKGTLTCAFDADVTGPFKSKFLLFKHKERHSPAANVSRMFFDSKTEETWTLTETGHYVCRVQIRFRGCAPFTNFKDFVDKTIKVNTLDGKCIDLMEIFVPLDENRPSHLLEITIASFAAVALMTALAILSFIYRKRLCKKITGLAKDGMKIAKKKTGRKRKTLKLTINRSSRKGDHKKTLEPIGKGDSKKARALFSIFSTSKSKLNDEVKKAKGTDIKKTIVQNPKKKNEKRKSSFKTHKSLQLLPQPEKVSASISKITASLGSSKAEKTSKEAGDQYNLLQ